MRLLLGLGSLVVLQVFVSPGLVAAPTGTFVGVLSEQRSFGDSMNTVTFFDSTAMSTPLFSVYVGREPVGGNEWEEPGAVAFNPVTGDVNVLCFDSGTAGINDTAGDTQGDYDLLKIPFSTLYDHWSTNFKGKDVRTLTGPLAVGGPAPTGVNNSTNLDYVIYANNTADFNAFHSNQFALAGSAEKIGQVARIPTGGGDFFDYSLDFASDGKLILLEDSINASDNPLDDHSIRVLTRNSTSPGSVTSSTSARTDGGTNYPNGGYAGANLNATFPQAATQSWVSKIVEKSAAGTSDPMLLNLDGTGFSEPKAIAYYKDPVTNVRGVWIAEGDMPATGDGIAFMQLDANDETPGYRPIAGGANPNYLTLSNDPAVGFDFKGSSDNIFVDKDSGDLVIVESGFNDLANGVGPDHQPGVLRVPVNYDNGSGQIQFGTWDTKKILNPTLDPQATGLVRGHWSDYDSVNNVVYFFMPGTSTDLVPNETDVYALDLDTGVTTSYLNVDDSLALFLGDSFGDKAVVLSFAAPGLLGDFNSDGKVDAGDYATWRKNDVANVPLANDNGAGSQAARYSLWRANFGNPPGAGSSLDGASVPEPASAVLLAIGLAAFCSRRRGA